MTKDKKSISNRSLFFGDDNYIFYQLVTTTFFIKQPDSTVNLYKLKTIHFRLRINQPQGWEGDEAKK
jgi:hypothetical protein